MEISIAHDYTACMMINDMLQYTMFDINLASDMKVGPFAGACYIWHNDTNVLANTLHIYEIMTFVHPWW